MRIFALVGFVLTIVALVPGNHLTQTPSKTFQRLILIPLFPILQPSQCRSHYDQAKRA